jgi:hypothetical protein
VTEHGETLELLEVAAVEPAGLDRLAAGDTPEAIAVAGHLAGCPTCTAEFERLRRTAPLLRDVIATEPPPELRERTLAFVRAVGRDRSSIGGEPRTSTGAASARLPGSRSARLTPERRRSVLWVAGLAAAVLLSVLGTSLVLNNSRNDRLGRDTGELVQVVDWTAEVERAPDARQVALGSKDQPAAGKLVFSPATRELVVFTGVLVEPPAGKEYRCWLEIGGQRVRIGNMQFGGGLAYWFGRNVAALDQVSKATRFGISLVDLSSAPSEDQTVLTAPL